MPMNQHAIFHRRLNRKNDGSNMAIRGTQSEIDRYHKRRSVIGGFPYMGKLKTKEEVLNYLDGTEIQCLICGKWFKALATHLVRIHETTVDDYKRKYGIPWTYGLICSDSSKKCSLSCKKRIASGDLDLLDLANKRTHFKSKQREQIGYARELCKKKAAKGRASIAEKIKRTSKVDGDPGNSTREPGDDGPSF
jgi:hypothetical protein